MSSNSWKLNQIQKQFFPNRAASEKQIPMNSFTSSQKLPIWNVSLFTLHISLLAGLMIASLPQEALAQQGKPAGGGWCSKHGSWTQAQGFNCPGCARDNRSPNGGGYSPVPQQPTGPSQAEIAARQAEEERPRQQEAADRIERDRLAREEVRKLKQFDADKAKALKSLQGGGPTGSPF